MFTYIRQNVRPWMLILAGIIIPFSILFFDAPERDECYQALSVLNYRQSPLAPLTFAGGYLWLKIFGVTVLNLRILSLLCHMIAIGIGCWFFWRRTGDRFWSAFMFMTLMTASQVWAMHIYNWDTGCYPFAMLTLVASVAFWRKPSLWRLTVVAAMAALFSLSRIPCAACIPLLAVVVLMRFRHRILHGVGGMVYLLFVSSLFFGAMMLLIYGGMDGIMQAWSPDNIITGHGAGDLMRYWARVKVIIPQITAESILPVICMVFAFIWVYLKRIRWRTLLWMIAVIEIILVLLLAILPVRTFFCLFILPVVILLLCPVLVSLVDRGRFGLLNYIGWLSLLFMVIPIIGSDGFMERFMVLPVFPVLASLQYNRFDKFIRSFMFFSFLAAFSMVIVKEAYYIKSGVNFVGNTVPRMCGIAVDDTTVIELKSMKPVLHDLDGMGARVAIAGSYSGAFIWNRDLLLGLHFFHLDSFADEMPVFGRSMEDIDALIVYWPVYYKMDAISDEVNQDDNDALERYILSVGFKKSGIQYPNFALYCREGFLPDGN